MARNRQVYAEVRRRARCQRQRLTGSVIHTAEIRVQSDLVDGLRKSVAALEKHRRKGGRGWEGDQPLQVSDGVDHWQT